MSSVVPDTAENTPAAGSASSGPSATTPAELDPLARIDELSGALAGLDAPAEPAPAVATLAAIPPRPPGWLGRLAGLTRGTGRLLWRTCRGLIHLAALPGLNSQQRMIVVVSLVSSLTLIPLTWYVSYHRLNPLLPTPPPRVPLSVVLDALDRGLTRQAEDLLARAEAGGTLTAAEQGAPDFVRGAILVDISRRMWEADQVRHARQAAKYLQQARTRGWPSGREAQGLALLCEALVVSGQGAAARPYISSALSQNPASAITLLKLATEAFFQQPSPDLRQALDYNSRLLALPDLPITERQQALLARARIFFEQRANDDCRDALREIRSDSEAALDGLLLQAELGLRTARERVAATDSPTAEQRAEAAQLIQESLDHLREALALGQGREAIARRAYYLMAVCHRELGEDKKAWETFQRTRTQFPQTPEGISACLAEAMLCERLNLHGDIIPTLIECIQQAGAAAEYDNPLLPLSELQTQLLGAYRALVDNQEFAAAARLAASFRQIFNPELSLEMTASAHVSRGRQLEAESQSQIAPQADKTMLLARAEFLLAGQAYAELARLRFDSPRYNNEVWRAGEYLLLGQEYAAAAEMFTDYLRYELRDRRPLALLNLGECQIQIGQPKQALTTLQECINSFPRDAASYRARLLTAQAFQNQGDLENAKRLYLANLESTQLTPASIEWRDALFALGSLLFEEAQKLESRGAKANLAAGTLAPEQLQAQERYREAIRRLGEAVERYPDSHQIITTRYIIAESYRALAAYPRERLKSVTIRTARDEYTKELRRLLLAAMEQYQQIQEILANRREDLPLNELEHSLLRNCYYSLGSSLAEMDRDEEAISIYTGLINRYQGEPEVLEAFLQLAQSQRKLGRKDEARLTLEQARVVLSRIDKSDQEFLSTSNHTREEWSRIIQWMIQL